MQHRYLRLTSGFSMTATWPVTNEKKIRLQNSTDARNFLWFLQKGKTNQGIMRASWRRILQECALHSGRCFSCAARTVTSMRETKTNSNKENREKKVVGFLVPFSGSFFPLIYCFYLKCRKLNIFASFLCWTEVFLPFLFWGSMAELRRHILSIVLR